LLPSSVDVGFALDHDAEERHWGSLYEAVMCLREFTGDGAHVVYSVSQAEAAATVAAIAAVDEVATLSGCHCGQDQSLKIVAHVTSPDIWVENASLRFASKCQQS